MKKSEVIKEGYVKGLKAAHKLIKESLSEGNGSKVFLANHTETRCVENTWNEGEIGSGTYWDGYLGMFEFSTPEEFIEILKKEVSHDIDEKSISVDSESDCGRVLVTYLGDVDGVGLNSKEIEEWKQGQFKAYSYDLEFVISLVQKNMSEILIDEFGWSAF